MRRTTQRRTTQRRRTRSEDPARGKNAPQGLRALTLIAVLVGASSCSLPDQVRRFGAGEARRLARILDPGRSLGLVQRIDWSPTAWVDGLRRRSARIARWPDALAQQTQRATRKLSRHAKLPSPRGPVRRLQNGADTARALFQLRPIGPRLPTEHDRAVDPAGPPTPSLSDRIQSFAATYLR